MKYFFTYKTMMFWIIFLLAAVTLSFFYMGEKADTYNPCKDPEKDINDNLKNSINSSKNFFKIAKFIPMGITVFVLIFLVIGHIKEPSLGVSRDGTPAWVFINLGLIFTMIMVTIIGISHVQNLLKIRHYQCGSSEDEQTKVLKTTVKACIVSIGCIIGSYIGLLANNWVKYDVETNLQMFVIILTGIIMIGGLAGGNMLIDNLNTKILGKNECGLFTEEIKALGSVGETFSFLNDSFGNLLPKGVSFKEKINRDFNQGQTPISVKVSASSGTYEPEETVDIVVEAKQIISLKTDKPGIKLVLPNNFRIQTDTQDIVTTETTLWDETNKVITKGATFTFPGVRLPKSLGKTGNISVLVGDKDGESFYEEKSSRNHFFIIQKKNSVFVNNTIAGGETNQIYKYTPVVNYESSPRPNDTVPTTGNIINVSNGEITLDDTNNTPAKLTLNQITNGVAQQAGDNENFDADDLVLLKHQDNTDENGVYKYIAAVADTSAKLVKQDITIDPGKFDFSNSVLMDNKIYDSTTEGIGFFEGVTNDTKIKGIQSSLERVGIETLEENKKALVKLFGDVYGVNDLKEDTEENEFVLIKSIEGYLSQDPPPTTADFMKNDHFQEGKIRLTFVPTNNITGDFKPVFNDDGTGEDDDVEEDGNNKNLFNEGKTNLQTAKTAAVDTKAAHEADKSDTTKKTAYETDAAKNEYYKNSLQLLIFYYNRKLSYPTLKIKYTGFPASGSMTFTLTNVKNPSYSGKIETKVDIGKTPQSYSIDIRKPDSESSTKNEYCPVITKYDFSKMLINSIFSGWAVSSIMYVAGSLYGRSSFHYDLGFTAGAIAPQGSTVINVGNDKTTTA